MQLQSDAGVGPANGGRPVTRAFEAGAKGVSRMEFVSVGELESSGDSDALRDAVGALEEKLRRQAAALPGQLEDAKSLARLLARRDWEQELDRRLAEDRATVTRAVTEFDRERTRYFAAVEAQVVKLALAIATRVLHREAKMDPLLLSAAVRVALEKVKDESETRLRVPANEAPLWVDTFAASGLENEVRVIGEDGMARGECVLETSVGTVELGIEAQLGEIERGFFDLMQKRPA